MAAHCSRAARVLLVLFLLCSCRSGGPAEPLIVVKQEAEGWWRVTWLLDAPVAELTFQRAAGGIRDEVFEVETPGWVVTPDGRMEGPPSRRIEVRIRQFASNLEKEYDFFELFSDGSAALYTGHFLAGPVRSYRFHPAPGQSIVVEGERHDGPVDWRDEHGQGTFVYFGTIEPVVSGDMISIVDPGLPDWLEERTRALLPRLFGFYTDRLGVALPDRPTVLFSYSESDASGYNSGGGTLPSVIQLGVEGSAWRHESAEGMLHLFHFLAHEAVHLWNGQLIHYPGSEDAWMHEGSADALTERTLLELGFIDEERFLEYQTAALNECLRRPGDVYSCGNMIALLTERSGADLFAFWRRLIEQVRRGEDNLYDAGDYLAVLESFGIGDVRSYDVVAALRARGVELVESDPPQSYGQPAARAALLSFLRPHCRGGYGFRATSGGLRLNEKLDCTGLAAGGYITAVDGRDVLREGAAVWDSLHAQCAKGAAVAITWRRSADAALETVELPCSTPIPARPPYLRIASLGER